ncbi:MAG: pyrimidine dimer DNA glycosylase/endonuclease V [Cardiobacterium sp.]
MTRINLVPPQELCDQHLLAEHRELTRIPNAVARGRYHLRGQPADYKLGEGHVRFFFDKLAFLQRRYQMLHEECRARGFNVQNIWPQDLPTDPALWQDYQPTATALATNRARIAERMPKTPRFTPPGATKSRASCPAKNEPSPIP